MLKTLAAFLFATGALTAAIAKDLPLSLHPDNPHYFLWRGRPTVLITSAEHYGAVMNLDFDYAPYLKQLEASKLNNTRVFSGAYVEPIGAFKIEGNTLAPPSERFIAPWARGSRPGYANGGNKFNLTRWDENYFKRLRDFVKQAGRRGVVVEMNLFCPFYEESQWKLSPQNAINNINGVGNVARTNVYTLDKNDGLLAVQEAMTRKIVTELNKFDNLDYSFVAGHERGDFSYPADQPGGGNPEFRRQMTVLRDFVHGFDFVRMKPDKGFLTSGVPEKMHAYALVEDGRQYAACFFDPGNAAPQSMSLAVLLPAGDYRVAWVDMLSGRPLKRERLKSPGSITITSPEFRREIALSIRR